MRLASAIAPSGADPAYPYNHTLDGNLQTVASAENADFEANSSEVGAPPENHDLELPPIERAEVPNGDFASGDFSSWSVSGTPTLQSDADRGHWARLEAAGDVLTSAPVEVPAAGYSLAYDVGYLSTTSYSGVDVYVLSGPDFASSTKVKSHTCNKCGRWSTSYVDLAAYKGQTVKVKFSRSSNQVGLDNAAIQEAFPGFVPDGSLYRGRTTGAGTFAGLDAGARLTSPAFTVDSDAQYASIRVQRASTLTGQYEIHVAPGPDFTAFTKVASGTSPASWQFVRFNVSAWRGQPIKVRFDAVNQQSEVDEIGRLFLEVPDWSVTGDASLVEDGDNNHIATTGTLTSRPITVQEEMLNVAVNVRSANTSGYYIELLRGADFATVVLLGSGIGPPGWEKLRFGVGPYSGESVKLRVRKYGGGTLEVDDAGLLESGLSGWRTTTTDGVVAGEDAFGSYISRTTSSGVRLRSEWISPGIIDRSGYPEFRYYALSYDIGYSSGSLARVYWHNDDGQSWTVFAHASNTPTGYMTSHFRLDNFMGERGYFVVNLAGSGRIYSIADNVARQQLSEPFSRKIGLGIDSSTGSMSFSEQDITVQGTLPLTFTRYYNAHSDRVGALGYRWTHTYDASLIFAPSDDVGVVFGSGREEFFEESSGSFEPADPRIQSTLVKHPDGTFRLTTKDNLAYQFSATGALARIVDPNGNTLALSHDGQGRLSTVTGEGDGQLTFTYDAQGRLSAVSDPGGASQVYGYDAGGDLTSVTDPQGGVRRYSYSRHRLTEVTDENGNLEAQNSYDDFNRVTSQTDALAKSITVAYDAPARGATQATDPEGGTATYYFDRYQRTTDAVDPVGQVVSFLYDGNGNLDKIIDPANNAWDFAFDSSADLTSTTDPLGNPVSIAYNPEHLPTTITDPRGNITELTYDEDGNLTSVTDALGNHTTYGYDDSGNVITATDPPNETTTYTYDDAGNRTSKTDALGNTWTYTYSAVGRLASETDPLGNTTRYFYDLSGRLIAERNPFGRETTFLYDLVGNLAMVEDTGGNRTTWKYDERGLVTRKTDPAGHVTTYSYDDNRRMIETIDPLGNPTAYAYDDAGRLISVTNPTDSATTYAYDGSGRLASKTDPIGRRTSYAYDSAGRPTGASLPNGSVLQYDYDAAGNLVGVTDPLGQTTTYSYDALNRKRRKRTHSAIRQPTASTDPATS